MEKIYLYLSQHKKIFYSLFIGTAVLFASLAALCSFEENIARLLPPTGDNLTVDLAFADLKVKDKIFIQAVARNLPDGDQKEMMQDTLQQAMDCFMGHLATLDEKRGDVEAYLYELDMEELLPVLPWLIDHAPAYLDFTDAEMDSLTSTEHIRQQVERYMSLLDTDLGMMLYDFIACDPCGILMSRLPLSEQSSSRFHNNHLFSPDGQVCFGYLTPAAGSMDSGKAGHLLRSVKQAKKQTESEYGNVEILYHGAPVMSANNARRIKRDLMLTIGIALLFILLLLAWCLKQFSSNLLLLLPVVYGAVFALAAVFVVRQGMSVMALGIGAIVLGVAISYSLHLIIQYKYSSDALATLRVQTRPIILSALTTIGAFAGLLFTQSSILKDFGLFAVFAMTGTTVACLLFMPHLFPARNVRNDRAFRFIERINSRDLSRQTWLVVLLLAVTGVCIAFSGRVRFDADLKHIGYVEPDVARSMKLYQEKQHNGSFCQYYAAVGKDLESTLQELKQIESACERLEEQGRISGFTRMSALMPSYQEQEERISRWQRYFHPEKREQVWRNIATACMLNDVTADLFVPFREAMAADYSPAALYEAGLLPDELMSNLIEQTGGYFLAFLPVRLDADSVNAVSDVLTQSASCLVLEPFYYTIDTVAMMQNDFRTILGISAIFVFLVLLLSFRRLSIALIAFLPMALSWYVVLGAMYLTNHEFNLINIVVSTFIFGIGVDYSIFMMDGLLRRQSANPADGGILLAHKTAITLSAAILIVCMLALLFAKHPAIQSIGFASLVGMASTLLLTYTLQPLLFRLLQSYKRKKQ